MNVYYCRLNDGYELYVHADSVLAAALYLESRRDLPKGQWVIDCVHRGDDDLDRGELF